MRLGEGDGVPGGLCNQPGPRSSPSSATYQLWASDSGHHPSGLSPSRYKRGPQAGNAWKAGTDAAPELLT